MNYPETLRYSKSHEWVKKEGEITLIGLTDFGEHYRPLQLLAQPPQSDSVCNQIDTGQQQGQSHFFL